MNIHPSQFFIGMFAEKGTIVNKTAFFRNYKTKKKRMRFLNSHNFTDINVLRKLDVAIYKHVFIFCKNTDILAVYLSNPKY